MDIAICCIGYNRVNSMARLLGSLLNADYPSGQGVTLYISVDKSNTKSVEEFAEMFEWPYGDKNVILHETNLGLRKHILSCGKLTSDHDALIVLEDDLVVAPNFYNFACACVERFKDDDSVAGISLYSFSRNYQNNLPFDPIRSQQDVFLMRCAMSWGQVWMPRQWNNFMEWYESNKDFRYSDNIPSYLFLWPDSSWLKYHTRYCIEKSKYFVFPYVSNTTCFAEAGVNFKTADTKFQVPLQAGVTNEFRLDATIKYDGFFEFEGLYDVLGMNEEELCLDIYGEKGNRENRRYWLTRQNLPYAVLKSFALDMKPAPQNIINDIKGREIFLYDTFEKAKKPLSKKEEVSNRHLAEYYFYGVRTDVRYNLYWNTRYKLGGIAKKLLGRK